MKCFFMVLLAALTEHRHIEDKQKTVFFLKFLNSDIILVSKEYGRVEAVCECKYERA